MTELSQPVRTRAEIAEAIRTLTAAQWVRLRKVATLYSLGRPMEAEDLLQETFRRALDSERKCPTGVDIVRFLAEAMRSIADSEYQRAKRRPAVVPLLAPGEPVAQAVDPIDPVPNVEEGLEGREAEAESVRRRQQIVALFGDDPVAQVIVEGMMEGMKGEDLRALTDLDATAYESKRTLIRRRIAKFIREQKP